MGGLDDSPAMQITGTIMVVAIIVLFLVVVFVLFLHLYARWFWWSLEDPPPPPSTFHRRRRRRRFVFTPTQDSVRRGLDLALLRSLPVVVFRSEDFQDGLECAVCLSELETGEKARLLPTCNHGFHVDCIDMWFQSHSTCPLCRNFVTPLPDCSPANYNEETGEHIHSTYEIPASTEFPNFPTNVLFWGDQNQVSAGGECLEGGSARNSTQLPSPPPSSSSSSRSSGQNEMLIIDVPEELDESVAVGEEESKSPVPPTRLRSFKRLLSRERRVATSTSEEV